MDEVPDRLVIVDGGVVSCEAAVWMTALGSSVTLLVRGDRLLERVEPLASEIVLKALTDMGVDVRLGVAVTACHRDDPQDTGLGRVHGGPVVVSTSKGDITADEILIAAGRKPRLDDVGLDTVGLTATGGTAVRPDDVPVPQVIFTEAEARGEDRRRGHACPVDRARRVVVGATFVGPEAGELLHSATIAITGQVPVSVLRHAVPSYPTVSELWLRLIEQLPVELLQPTR